MERDRNFFGISPENSSPKNGLQKEKSEQLLVRLTKIEQL